MRSPKLLSALFFSSVALVVVHRLAIHYSLYWRISWFDNLSHVLGGVSIGFFAAWVYAARGFPIRISVCALAAFAIGIECEIFEYVEQFPVSPFMSYPLDTVKDLCVDTLGAVSAAILARRLA